MKSQRRHELEANDLAKRLSAAGDRVRPYSTAITVTVVAIAAVVLVALFISGRRAANRRASWDQFTFAITSASIDWDGLRAAAQDNPNTPMSELANVTWADNELRMATLLFFRDQAAAETHLENAQSVYRQLITEAEDSQIANRARLGMARVLEMQGEPEEAAKYYQAVEGAFSEFAHARAKELAAASVQESVTWLATADMPEIQTPTGPGTPGMRPPFSDFQIDPTIPSRIPSGVPAGTTGAGVPDPLAPAGARTGDSPLTAEEPLDFENPFARPSDPDRYATPPADGAGGAPSPESSAPADGESDAAASTEEAAGGESSADADAAAADDEGEG